jgi:hypothetical protein
MFHEVVAKCRKKGIKTIAAFAEDSDMTLRGTRYWLQEKGISWDSVIHSIAYLDILDDGWWEDAYPLHPDEPLVRYHKLYCSAWGVILRKESRQKYSKRFYRYMEVGYYKGNHIGITFRKKGTDDIRTEFLHNIVAKCFLDKKPSQKVLFKNNNTYDCHVWNLTLEDTPTAPQESSQPPQGKIREILDEWGCKQCEGRITSPEGLYFRHDTIFCSENCADVFEEDLKFVQVSVDLEESDWYNTFDDY